MHMIGARYKISYKSNVVTIAPTAAASYVNHCHHLIALFYLTLAWASLVGIMPTIKRAHAAGVDYCYSDIGCFPLSAEFYHPRHRPFNARPLHRRHIRTQFELFNRAHPEGFILQPWNRFNLLQSRFDPRLETKIIVPGWLDNINRALWVRKLKDALLWLWAPANIIVVRWTNFTPYTIATANTRVVGAEMANLMRFIEHELAYDPAYYHIIGHSLGAHIAGYCGDRVHGLGRITALDPARPFFQHMPKSVRLDRGDAKFVDAIHSDFTPENAIFLLMSFGMTTPVGHLDFYPNGPPLFQPGCMRDTLLSVQTGIAKGLEAGSLSVAFMESVRYLTACDHQRSHEWFIESITNRECAFVGVRCNEFEGMINGRCTCDDSPSACAIMGINADQMYLNNVHEELWPIRAGSIDYKYKSYKSLARRPRPPPPPPVAPLYSQAHARDQLAMMMMTMEMQAQQSPVLVAPPVNLEHLGSSAEHNLHLLAQSAALVTGDANTANAPPTRDEVYARLKQQMEQAHANAGEPTVADTPTPNYHHAHHQPTTYRGHTAPPAAGPIVYSDALPPSTGALEDDGGEEEDVVQADASEQHAGPTLVGLDGLELPTAMPSHGALEDLAFVEYLRAHLLGSSARSDSVSAQRRNDSDIGEEAPQAPQPTAANKTANIERRVASHMDRDGPPLPPPRYEGHPVLLSSMRRDIESWYEDNARWHLKTNNRPSYCSNQYQLLIYLGALKTSSGRDKLRANLVVSIVGTRGQLLNQRFIPRGSSLTSFTMQPFFILLEGSYSLGQIKSVALAWEARTDPDPVQATVTFQSSLVQQLGERVPAYKAQNFPWLPEETRYDHTHRFKNVPQHVRAHGPRPPMRIHRVTSPMGGGGRLPRSPSALAGDLIRSSLIKGHYSRQYQSLERRAAEFDTPLKECRLGVSAMNTADMRAPPVGCATIASNSTRRNRTSSRVRLSRRTDLDDETTSAATMDTNRLDTAAENDVDDEQRASRPNLLEELLRLREAEQRDLLMLAHLRRRPIANQTTNVILAAGEQVSDEEEEEDEEAPANDDLSPSSSEPYFVPLVDPPSEPAMYVPKPGAHPAGLEDHEGELTLDLHNVDLHARDTTVEDSIVINQVVVSPLQATYGRYGRNARTFCPPRPMSTREATLKRDQTIQLAPTLMARCQHHNYPNARRRASVSIY